MKYEVGLVALGLLLSGGAAWAESPPPPDSPAVDEQDRVADGDREQYRRDDLFCRRQAAASTGYVSPGRAAREEQVRGTIGGTALGAIAGALFGAAGGNAGAGAAIGAGAGLLAGTAVGADNARQAAADVERQYAAAYYDCMDNGGADEARDGDERDYAELPPPPPPPPPVYYYDYYYYRPAPVIVPAISFGFGFGGYHHWHHHHHHHH